MHTDPKIIADVWQALFDGWPDIEHEQPTEAEMRRLMRRHKTFVQDGLDNPKRLAVLMLMRDRSGDDRRLCYECRHLRSNDRCLPRILPAKFVLMRCEHFTIKR